jgi:hypothetical protein
VKALGAGLRHDYLLFLAPLPLPPAPGTLVARTPLALALALALVGRRTGGFSTFVRLGSSLGLAGTELGLAVL